MKRLQHFTKIPTAVIKSRRNKVVQAIDKGDPNYFIVKIITFHREEEFLCFEKDVGQRLDVLKRISGLGIISIVENGVCGIQVKQKESEWVVYLTRREVSGPTLLRVLENQSLAVQILRSEGRKELIWNIFAVMIGGGGFPTLIVTLDNLILEEVGDKYKPALNYFSFCGMRLLSFRKDIERDEFLEIAMFLDEEALETGNLDRFQFKCRNFAILVLSLLVRRNPNNFIFYNVELPNSISIEKAKQLYAKVIRPRIEELLSFKTIKNSFKTLNIPGLEDFVHSALGFERKEMKIEDWSTIQKVLMQEERGECEEQNVIGRLLWQNQSESVKKVLEGKGLGLGKNGVRLYMAFKISVHLEYLLQFNDWKSMMKKLSYNYKTHEMFYRLLQCTALKDSPVLQQTTKELISLSKESFKMRGEISGKKVVTEAYQRSILDCYSQLMEQ